VGTLTKIEIIKKKVEERKKAVEGLVEEALREGRASNREQAFHVFVPRHLKRNVVLDVLGDDRVAVILYGDDRFDEGFIKKIELRLGEGALLSEFKKWAVEEGIIKALQYALAVNKAAPPPRTKEEEEKYVKFREELAILKHELGLLKR
jgi:hypothetical protein